MLHTQYFIIVSGFCDYFFKVQTEFQSIERRFCSSMDFLLKITRCTIQVFLCRHQTNTAPYTSLNIPLLWHFAITCTHYDFSRCTATQFGCNTTIIFTQPSFHRFHSPERSYHILPHAKNLVLCLILWCVFITGKIQSWIMRFSVTVYTLIHQSYAYQLICI